MDPKAIEKQHLETVIMGKCKVRNNLYYSKDHVWARIFGGEKVVRVGLDDFAQGNAGRIRFVSTKLKRTTISRGKTFSMIEAYKWVGPLKSPLSGVIVETNQLLKRKPSLLNEDPYGDGWIMDIKPVNLEEEIENLYYGPHVFNWIESEIKKWTT